MSISDELEHNEPRKVVGQATIRIKISVECDAWPDYDCEWQYAERSTCDLQDPEHFGRIVALHAVVAAQAVCRNGNVCDEDSVLRGLRDRLRDSADEMDEWLPPAESSD